jgi:hypothetical protein
MNSSERYGSPANTRVGIPLTENLIQVGASHKIADSSAVIRDKAAIAAFAALTLLLRTMQTTPANNNDTSNPDLGPHLLYDTTFVSPSNTFTCCPSPYTVHQPQLERLEIPRPPRTSLFSRRPPLYVSTPYDPVHLTHLQSDSSAQRIAGMPKAWAQFCVESGLATIDEAAGESVSPIGRRENDNGCAKETGVDEQAHPNAIKVRFLPKTDITTSLVDSTPSQS